MRIVIATDAWSPQVNGVVRTLQTTKRELERLGHEVVVIEPSQFSTIPCPFYPEIPLAYGATLGSLAGILDPLRPCAIHIPTEGPIGLAVRRYCRRRKLPFTTSYHTNFPEYLRGYLGIPESWMYEYFRRFHRGATRIMVSTETVRKKLKDHHFESDIAIWSRGVETDLFRPRPDLKSPGRPPRFVHVGRVALEKNIRAFLEAKVEGHKVVIGDGPEKHTLEKEFPNVEFVGVLKGEALAEEIAKGDLLVFPSKSDTFGLVMLEALACGLPVAAYRVQGPIDIIADNQEIGCLDDDLEVAMRTALERCKPEACRQFALGYTWERCTRQFLENLAVTPN